MTIDSEMLDAALTSFSPCRPSASFNGPTATASFVRSRHRCRSRRCEKDRACGAVARSWDSSCGRADWNRPAVSRAPAREKRFGEPDEIEVVGRRGMVLGVAVAGRACEPADGQIDPGEQNCRSSYPYGETRAVGSISRTTPAVILARTGTE